VKKIFLFSVVMAVCTNWCAERLTKEQKIDQMLKTCIIQRAKKGDYRGFERQFSVWADRQKNKIMDYGKSKDTAGYLFAQDTQIFMDRLAGLIISAENEIKPSKDEYRYVVIRDNLKKHKEILRSGKTKFFEYLIDQQGFDINRGIEGCVEISLNKTTDTSKMRCVVNKTPLLLALLHGDQLLAHYLAIKMGYSEIKSRSLAQLYLFLSMKARNWPVFKKVLKNYFEVLQDEKSLSIHANISGAAYMLCFTPAIEMLKKDGLLDRVNVQNYNVSCEQFEEHIEKEAKALNFFMKQEKADSSHLIQYGCSANNYNGYMHWAHAIVRNTKNMIEQSGATTREMQESLYGNHKNCVMCNTECESSGLYPIKMCINAACTLKPVCDRHIAQHDMITKYIQGNGCATCKEMVKDIDFAYLAVLVQDLKRKNELQIK
jgi:hypothetical protein